MLPPQEFHEERRLATVLFADIRGFTTLAERLDFEKVSDLIKEIWLRLDQVIVSHGGYIDKHIGDGVMAVWGAPHAGEDDAERAVTAALEMQSSLEAFADQSDREGAESLKLRIGINTGLVIADYVGLRNEYTVMGDTVNVASRLEECAEAGQVIISESTYRMVRGAFRVKQIQPLHLRGRKEPVQAYLVMGKLEQPTRMRYRDMGGVETRLVGRQEEVLRLYSAYQRVRESSTPAWVLVSGEAGIGKSRLLMEFANRLEVNEPGVFLMSGRGMERTENVPYFLWKSLFHNRFGMSDNMPLDEACERFMKGIVKLWGDQNGNFSAEEAAYRIGDLIGLQWPEHMAGELIQESPLLRTRKAFQAMKELFGRVCNGGVVVLLLDDLQWADKRSLDLITYLVRPDSEPLRLLALGGARPRFFRRDFPGKDLAEVIPLKPIPFNAEMVRAAYPALANVSKPVLRDLARRADGNPYFLEEMVKSLLMRKREVGETRYLTVPDYFPETLQAMLQARLDELPRDARDVAMLASVVGRVFWLDAVTTIARYPARTGLLHVPLDTLVKVVKSALDKLMLAEMVFPRAGSVFVGEQEFIFKHTLLRDAAYSRLPEKYRRLYHNVVAQWLRQRASPDFYARVAEHYELGGNQQESIKYYRMAAEYARSRGAEEEAEELQRRAKMLVRDTGE